MKHASRTGGSWRPSAPSRAARRPSGRPRRPGPPAAFQVPVEYSKLPQRPEGRPLARHDGADRGRRASTTTSASASSRKDRTGLRAPLRAHDVPGLGEPRQDGVHQARRSRTAASSTARRASTSRTTSRSCPSHALETTLWAEADRMRGLAITGDNLKNQQEVVKNEVKVNVLNQPYGGFPWLDLPQYANTNWYNAHNFYGDLKDLDAATLEDVSKFFKTFYAPNNAVLVVVGDFDPAQTKALDREVLRRRSRPSKLPPKPDISEPRQEKEKRATKDDALATRPALAIGYHAPPRNTPEYYAMGLLDQILVQGKDSRLYQALVQKSGLTGDVDGGINSGLGNMFNINGPTLWDVSLFHDKDKTADQILDGLRRRDREDPHDAGRPGDARPRARQDALGPLRQDRAVRRLRQGRPARLASRSSTTIPAKINQLEAEFRKVTPALIQKTAQEYLRPDEPHDPRSSSPRPSPRPRRRADRRKRSRTMKTRIASRSRPRSPSRSRACSAPTSRRRRRPATPKGFSRARSRRRSRSTTASPSRSCPTARCPRSPCGSAVAHRQRRREGRPGLARRPDRRHAVGGHEPRAPPRRSPRTRRAWAARSTSPSARTAPTSAATCSRSSGPQMVALVADVARNPKFPESELARLQGRPRCGSSRSREPAAAARAGEVPRRALRRLTRTGALFPTEAMLQGYTIAQVPRLLRQRNFGAARAHLYVVGRFDAPAVEAAVRKAFADWKRGAAPDASRRRRRRAHAPSTSWTGPAPSQSTINLGHAGHRPVAARLGPALPDERAARRLLLLAHHLEHPRAEGLHVLAASGQLSTRYRDAYWVEIADVTTNVTGPGDQGDPGRDRPPAGRAAVGEGAQGVPELPRRRLRPAELLARRHHRPARVRGPARPAGRLPERLRRSASTP